jgi:MFS family permease
MNKYGRKKTMLGLVVPFLIGWSLVIWAQNFVMMLIGRIFIGAAGGAFCMISPQYSGEIAEKEIRGILGTFMQLMLNVGILVAYISGAFVDVVWISVFCGILPIIFAAIFIFMPESPVYLVTEKKIPEAVMTYKWLRGDAFNPQWEIDDLVKEIEDSKAQKSSFWDNLRKRATIRAMVISFGLMFFQQMCGINVVLFSATFIFEACTIMPAI